MAKDNAGVTLVEVIIVIIIIAVVASIGIPTYEKTVEEARRKEAKSMLSLVANAEKIYQIDSNSYYGFAVLDDTARDTLAISVYDNQDWSYSVDVSGVDSSTATAKATRKKGKRAGGIISMDVGSETLTEYAW